MSRPKKQGMEYFTVDVNFYQDIKIRKLIRYKGVQAVSIYHILLCQIYASGYYLLWDNDIPFTVSEVAHLEEDYVKNVIDYCLEIDLFDKSLYVKENVLTSHGIQQRFLNFCSVAKRRLPADLPYLLVELKDDRVISEKTGVITEETQVNTEETGVITEETPINSVKSTQSKVKESKVKHSSSADIRAREGDGSGWSGDDLRVCDSVDDEITLLRASPIWKEQLFMRFGFLEESDHRLDEYLTRWGLECKGSGRKHLHIGDAKKHFMNWLIIQEDKSNKISNGYDINNNGYRTSEDLRQGCTGIIARMAAEAHQTKTELPVV